MGILTGSEILKQMEEGALIIDPFQESSLNPNSYNLRLSEVLMTPLDSDLPLDMKKPSKMHAIKIPETGLLLQPGCLYLGRTKERTWSDSYIPMIEGRSSIGRLGIFIHVTAGFGDLGFNGFWTLEITCIVPVKIYAGAEVGQVFFHTPEGSIKDLYNSKYNNNKGIQTSRMFMDFQDES